MSINMETRKVQKTGGSSYIISLPKPWIDKHGVEKNDTLGILSQADGNLLITPKINLEEYIKSKIFDVDDITDSNYLFRLLIGAYIMGYNIITIKSSRKFEQFIRDTITNFTQIAIGPEIVKESNNIITIKDLLNPKEMPFEMTIKRMYILVQNMHEDAKKALANHDKKLAKDVVKRDNDVDRLHWLIGRQSHIVLKDIILCQKMGVTLEEAVHFQQISRFLERIGDHAVKIAKNVLLMDYNKTDKKILDEILKASEFSLELLERSLDSWLQKSMILANDTIESIKELTSITEKINSSDSIAIGYILESIRRTSEYAGDICEVIINNLV